MKKLHNTRHQSLIALTSLIAIMATSSPSFAQLQEQGDEEITMTTAISDLADQSPIVMSGTIGDIRGDEFDLNYGTNSFITVELDRFNWVGNETDYLSPGERVTVHGFIDDDLFEGREIEAYNLQLHQRSTYYLTDTEQATQSDYSVNGVALEDGAYITVTGTVTEVSTSNFDIITSDGDKFMVDAKDLHPPLRRENGTYFVAPGDRVNIRGNFDMRYFQNKTIFADRIIKLVDSGIAP